MSFSVCQRWKRYFMIRYFNRNSYLLTYFCSSTTFTVQLLQRGRNDSGCVLYSLCLVTFPAEHLKNCLHSLRQNPFFNYFDLTYCTEHWKESRCKYLRQLSYEGLLRLMGGNKRAYSRGLLNKNNIHRQQKDRIFHVCQLLYNVNNNNFWE